MDSHNSPVVPSVLNGTLARARFRFASDVPDLLAYARRHVGTMADCAATEPDVQATLHWHDGQPPEDRSAIVPTLSRLERVDRDLYVGAEELHWFRVDDLRDLHLHFAWRGRQLSVRADFYHRLAKDSRRDRAKRLLYRRQLAHLRERRFTTLLYYLVYYPCWWWLEQTQGMHPIHAAGVQTPAGLILLGGASGIGKSTLSVALATEPGAALLSDSFVMQRGTEVLPVREPILLDAWSRRWLGTRMEELEPIDWRYCLKRAGFHLPERRLAGGGRAAMLVLPRRAPQFCSRRIAPAQAHARLSAANFIINDLRRYWAFAAVLEQLAPAGLTARRETELAKLAAEVPCFELGLTVDVTSAAAVEAVLALFEAPPLRVGSAPM